MALRTQTRMQLWLVAVCAPAISSASAVGSPESEGASGSTLPTPSWLVGACNTVWNTHLEKYKFPYPVEFRADGNFVWWAPYADGSVREDGRGVFLTPPLVTVNSDGSWETGYFSSNQFTHEPNNSTLCTCEYVSQASPEDPRILTDYVVATVPGTYHLPMEEVCKPYLRVCPVNNASANAIIGNGFTEVYSTCVPLGTTWEKLEHASIIVVVLISGLALALLSWYTFAEDVWIAVTACQQDEGYMPLGKAPSLKEASSSSKKLKQPCACVPEV